MKKVFTIILALVILSCLLLLLGVNRSAIISEIFIPKYKLFAAILNETIAEVEKDKQYDYEFSIPYVGTYEVSLFFEDEQGNPHKVVDNDSSKIRISAKLLFNGKILKQGNTDWFFERTGISGGGSLLIFSVPNEVPKSKKIQLSINANMVGDGLIQKGIAIRIFAKRMSSLLR